ncbi:MAG TPA: hypothetical protein PKA28_11550 [Methylomusa anaerophila]|uniref:DUF7852 domain-containing protein n=1 Tax=Methylomusa anaerophila TaxID=1930071 RepID=A0A348AFN7_9FIRM|nr:hypothetical protein [Methylomusa anaerophila]BBB89885.1 hypothetical protein MAMMFC1_00525 [Methylomusa anaerophila]HML89069.1 hypothetical protein [Methylomusa anaerophila]
MLRDFSMPRDGIVVPELPRIEPGRKAKVLETKTLQECHNEEIPTIYKNGIRSIKVPVELKEVFIQIPVESTIRLEEPALEIKRIKKSIQITQCKLVVPVGRQCNAIDSKLFLAGLVRKNIEYANVKCIDDSIISGDIRHTTVSIPFECATEIKFTAPNIPVLPKQAQTELNFLHPNGLGPNTKEQRLKDFQFLTEEPFCELEFASITEVDIELEQIPVKGAPFENVFQTFTEKLVLNILVKVLQNQQVLVRTLSDCIEREPKPNAEKPGREPALVSKEDKD